MAGSVVKMALDDFGVKQSAQYASEAVTLGAENVVSEMAEPNDGCSNESCQ